MACSKLVTELLLKTVYIQYWLKAVLFENNSPNYAAAVATGVTSVYSSKHALAAELNGGGS
jgi:hypothetical protein